MKAEEIIFSITEAFSMQPLTLYVKSQREMESYFDKPKAVKEIKFEYETHENEILEYYVGYNFDGKKLFKYLVKSVNVHYGLPDQQTDLPF